MVFEITFVGNCRESGIDYLQERKFLFFHDYDPNSPSSTRGRLWMTLGTRGVDGKRFRWCAAVRIPISWIILAAPCRECHQACR